MRVLLSTYGSRGDVQPLVAMALELKARGVEPRLSAPADAEFKVLLDRAGVELAPAFMPVRDWIAAARDSGLALPQLVAKLIPPQYRSLAEAAEGCDAILATGLFPSTAAAQAVAESRGVAFASAHFCPRYLPSPHFPPIEFPGWPHPSSVTDNLALWEYNALAIREIFGNAINMQRAAVGLPRLDAIRDYVNTPRPWIASDQALSPWLANPSTDAIQTGAWLLTDSRPLEPELEAFLAAGSAPVYVGFGSMAMTGSVDLARVATDAVRAQGRRLILSSGWANLAPIDERSDCISIGEVNQRALFPRVAAVIHHGGAGTTTTAALAGSPQVIIPQVADQPYWASRVVDLGIGAALPGPIATVDTLWAALARALTSETRRRAKAFSGLIATDGAGVAADLLLAVIEHFQHRDR